jgi:hypothetical protein
LGSLPLRPSGGLITVFFIPTVGGCPPIGCPQNGINVRTKIAAIFRMEKMYHNKYLVSL